MNNQQDALKAQVFGHEPGLFLLFFTEMWERFSYYGMRALLVLFLVSEIVEGGWSWSRGSALQLYAVYTGLVYLTPILGGIIADKLLGYRNAVILGAFLMTLGHASMACETAMMFYIGLGLLILGNGFFKPNISTIVGQLYRDNPDKKDAAYTIFYMGINAGAFLGILLCGYIGETWGWNLGFGLAGIFMFLGMVMFYLGQSIFGELGKRPSEEPLEIPKGSKVEEASPLVVRDRLIVIGVLSFFTIFFWMAFEQAGGSMTIFAKDYTGRTLMGSGASTFFWVNTALTIGPLAVLTFVLFKLFASTYKQIPFSNMAIGFSFVIIWFIAIWMIKAEYNKKAYEVRFASADANIEVKREDSKEILRTIPSYAALETGQEIFIIDRENKKGQGKIKVIRAEDAEEYETKFVATVVQEKANEIEVPASWFGILNSFFIIVFAPVFSRIWESKFNPSAPVKFGMGLILLGLGFGVLAIGSMGIANDQKTAAVSMWFLIGAYLFHTLGELCVSPVGLSYVSKLAPAKLVGLMFGVWFLATAVANFLAGQSGSYIDMISEKYSLTVFFLIFTAIPILAGLVMWCLNGTLKRKMHGIT